MPARKKNAVPPSAAIAPAIQDRSVTTRVKLLEATIRCFEKYGVTATNTTMISEEAGLTRGAYLHHFKSRETLIAAAVASLADQARFDIETSIRQLFYAKRPPNLYITIWKRAYPDVFYVGYEMMLSSRHNEYLQREWQYQSAKFAKDRLNVLEELFEPEFAREEAYPFLEGLADFFRGIKLMEVVRSEAESRRVIQAFAPIFDFRIEQLRKHLIVESDAS